MKEPNQPPQDLVILSDGTPIDPNLIYSNPGERRVGLFTEFPQISVAPGKSTTISVVVLNQGQTADGFLLSVGGVPTSWLESLPPVLQLAPGGSEKVTLILTPPRWPQSKAGRYPLTIQAASQEAPDLVAEVKVTLTVTAYSEFISELAGDMLEAGGPIQVTVQNQGNTQTTFTVICQDAEGDLVFEPPEVQLTLSEGEAAVAEFRAALRQPRWIGGVQAHLFTAQVSAPEGEPQTHSGEVMSNTLIPAWTLLLLFVLCLGCAVMALLYDGVSNAQAASATQTTIAQQTGVVAAINTASAQQTASVFASQTAAAAQTASVLATQTAFAAQTAAAQATLTTDTDNDGLTDLEEIQLGTSPMDPDNDHDGLSDGEEKSWRTNPFVMDTDGDTLSDGMEVHILKTSPINPDTDGDGLNDNVDPDPLHLPTPTAQPTAAVSSTATLPAPILSTATSGPLPPAAGRGAIVFQFDRDDKAEIYVMNADGSAQTRLTSNTVSDTEPAWSPDGGRIAFVSNRDGNPEIYLMNADGSTPTRLTNNNASDTGPAWSPDGGRIAFVSDWDGNSEIYVMNADGSTPIRLTNINASDTEPAWSPDGGRIAFVSNRDGNSEIYLMNADGSTPIRLTQDLPLLGPVDQSPAWSPDGARLAFVSTRDGNMEIYVMNTDGLGQTRLTTDVADDFNPAWSPDGARLALVSDRDGDAEIYVMNADGSSLTQLTNNTVADLKPAWQPQR